MITRPRRLRSDSVQTQSKLIAVAEQLFAERGIDGVSLSEINRAADQGNNSALHYHFGSKDGLFDAILQKHMKRLDESMSKYMETLPDDPSLRDMISVLVRPFADRFDDEDGGVYYLQILCQAHANPDQELFQQIMGDPIPETYRPLGLLMFKKVEHISEHARLRRFQMMSSAMLLGLNSIITSERKNPELVAERSERVEELIDALTGMMSAASTAA